MSIDYGILQLIDWYTDTTVQTLSTCHRFLSSFLLSADKTKPPTSSNGAASIGASSPPSESDAKRAVACAFGGGLLKCAIATCHRMRPVLCPCGFCPFGLFTMHMQFANLFVAPASKELAT